MNKAVLRTAILSALAPALINLSANAATLPPTKLKSLDQPTQKETANKRFIVTFKDSNPRKNTETSATSHPSVFAKGHFSAAKAANVVQRHGGQVKHQLKSISAIAAELTPAQIAQLKNDPQVARIEEDPPRFAQAASTPYGISMVQADLVSDSEIGNQKVCVVDTGYDINHEDLMNSPNITGEVSNTLTATVNLGDWSTDSYGHGTHVAGIISSLNNAVGTEGVAPNGLINMHIVKVIHKANYWAYWGSDVIAAIEACQTAGSTVINMSMAGFDPSVAEEAAIDAAYNSGTLLVAASGNRGNSSYYYPASYDSVISVGGVDQQKDAWMYTQINDQIELAAPGFEVHSTLPNNRYGYMDGTSAATPFVSGVAALVWSHHQDCTNIEIRDALQRSALDRGTAGRDDTYGYGIVQAKAAHDLLTAEGCAASTPEVVNSYTDPVDFANVTTVEPVDGLTTGLVPDDWITSASAAGVRCVAAGGFTLQSSNNRIAVQTGSFSFLFDVGVNSVSFNAYLQGAGATVTVKTAAGTTEVINLTADGFVGINSTEAIIEVTILGADGLEITDLSRSVAQNGVSTYTDETAFASAGATTDITDVANSTTKDLWFGEVNGPTFRCVAATNVGIASAGSNDFNIAPTTTDIITSDGNQDFTIEFNFPPNLLSFNTHLNEYGPVRLIVTTVDDVQTEYSIAHDPAIVGFFGLESVQNIKSIRWIAVNGDLVKTGISNLKADVVSGVGPTPESINTAIASSAWGADPATDAIDGNFGSNVYTWISSNVDPAPWLQLEMTTPTTITHYHFSRGYCSAEAYFAGSWTISGSNDTTNWTQIEVVAADQSAFFPKATACTEFGPTYPSITRAATSTTDLTLPHHH